MNTANPLAKEKLKQIQAQNRTYVAHEYFTRDWLRAGFQNAKFHLCNWSHSISTKCAELSANPARLVAD